MQSSAEIKFFIIANTFKILMNYGDAVGAWSHSRGSRGSSCSSSSSEDGVPTLPSVKSLINKYATLTKKAEESKIPKTTVI